jgi:hypothetical protein
VITKCFKCGNPIGNSTIRLFIDSNKEQQVCSKCWKKECEEKFVVKKETDTITSNKIIRK